VNQIVFRGRSLFVTPVEIEVQYSVVLFVSIYHPLDLQKLSKPNFFVELNCQMEPKCPEEMDAFISDIMKDIYRNQKHSTQSKITIIKMVRYTLNNLKTLNKRQKSTQKINHLLAYQNNLNLTVTVTDPPNPHLHKQIYSVFIFTQ
jgi:hypothetical protein